MSSLEQYATQEFTPGPEVAEVASFYDTHKPLLKEYFSLLQNEDAPIWANTLEEFVAHTQRTVGGDHSQANWIPEIAFQDENRAREIYRYLGLTEEITPPAGHHDYILVYGAVQIGSNSRLALMERMWQQGVTGEEVVLFGGPRKPFKVEAEDIAEDLMVVGTHSEKTPWLKSVLESSTPSERIESEREGVRLAVERQLGPLALRRIELVLNNERPFKRHEFTYHGQQLHLLDCTPVERPQGDPRATTASCTAEFLRVFQPKNGSRILSYVAQPHAERMRKTIARIIRENGRDDLKVTVGASAGQKNLKHTHHWREMVAHGYEDLQAKSI